jgi:hypothetical protein
MIPWEKRNPYVLMGKPEGKRLEERPKPRLEDNINMDLRETGWVGVGWSLLVQIWTRILKK